MTLLEPSLIKIITSEKKDHHVFQAFQLQKTDEILMEVENHQKLCQTVLGTYIH